MTRRMSCSLTVDAVRDRTKTVTRRHVDTWRTLTAGDRLVLVEKAMGLPKGARQVILAEVDVVDVRVEPLSAITPAEIVAEGFGRFDWTPLDFARFWLGSHGYNADLADPSTPVRRIEWNYR